MFILFILLQVSADPRDRDLPAEDGPGLAGQEAVPAHARRQGHLGQVSQVQDEELRQHAPENLQVDTTW